MSNKIKTAIRVRPFLPTQKKHGSRNTLIDINQEKQQISINEENSTLRKFHFDYLFNQSSSQEDVYKECKISEMIDKALEGYHSTIFAYGQTGSGKTHTMQGSECVEDGSNMHIDGVIPRVIKDLFRKVESFQHRRTLCISVSFLQIYNEKIFDLLNPSSLNNKNFSSNINGLRLRWNKDEQFSVENLFVFECKNHEELMKFFLYGLKNRISSSHRLNMQSSRSHSILSIKIQSFQNSDPSQILSSKIQLVDLAGSERIGMTGTEGRLAKQSIDINKSLFTLRQVISILAQVNKGKGKQKIHVPYRDSKLTSILKQSIGGNSYSLMIACINPNDQFIEENISTLTYATKASFITNQPVINDDPRNKLINQLRKQVKQLNEELGKANEHIQFMTNLNNELNSTQMDQSERNTFFSTHSKSQSPGKTGMSGSFTLSPMKNSINHNQTQNENDLPIPKFKKKISLTVNKNNNEFSQRLIQSIHMVRELLKSNKDLREQLEASNKQAEQKNLEIYELTRQNDMLRQKCEFNNSTYGFERQSSKDLIQNDNLGLDKKFFEKENGNFKPRSTGVQSLGKSMGTGLNQKVGRNGTSQSKGSFNYWNSVEVNQFYLNQRGIDSQPTNFMKREINTAQQTRGVNISRGKSSESQRHANTPKISTRKNWISKHSEPKKLLSFYNDPHKEAQFY